MRLAAIDYHLRTSDSRLCAQARGMGVSALELTRGSMLTERRWLSLPDGAERWFSSALSMGIALESISATFAYEWSPVDRKGRVDDAIIEAVAGLVETAALVGASGVHVPCLDAPAPETPADARRLIQYFEPALEKAHQRGVSLYVETNWPAESARRVAELDPQHWKISLDVGNTIALGRDLVSELDIMGSSLGQLRLRDRRRYEIFRSLPLGYGDVDWSGLQQHSLKLSQRPQVVLAATGGASLVESYASAQRLLYHLLAEPAVSRVA